MRNVRTIALALLVALTTTGCATLFASGSEQITIDSQPQGARVSTQYGQPLGVTPFQTRLDPKNTYVLRFEKEGYVPSSFAVGHTIDGITFLNLLCVLCWGVDALTGAMWGLDTNRVMVTLNPRVAQLTPEQRGAVNLGVPVEHFVPMAHGH
jgi:hypothetical protein